MYPIDALRQRIVGRGIVCEEIIAEAHDAVGGGATASAGNGNLGSKATAG